MQRSEWPVSGKRSHLRIALLLAVMVALTVVPPSLVERLPSVCLNHRLFGWCPGCGSLRALVRFFHGDFAGAVRFNPNVLVTAPLLVLLLLDGLRRALRSKWQALSAACKPAGAGRSGAVFH